MALVRPHLVLFFIVPSNLTNKFWDTNKIDKNSVPNLMNIVWWLISQKFYFPNYVTSLLRMGFILLSFLVPLA